MSGHRRRQAGFLPARTRFRHGGLASALALLALLVNLFGWIALPSDAHAAAASFGNRTSVSSLTALAQSSICHAEDENLPGHPKGAPFCVLCFPLLSAASGAMAPVELALPPPPAPVREEYRAASSLAAQAADSVVYPARAPPART